MPIKVFNPTTPSSRHRVSIDFSTLAKKRPEKKLTTSLPKSSGRSKGRITSRRRGGGHKRLYRIIDFNRNKSDIPATVLSIEYDPNRSAFIALIEYDDSTRAYIIAPNKLEVGSKVMSSYSGAADIKVGNAMPIRDIPVGTVIHNIELKPKKGAQLARAAGSYAQLVSKDQMYASIKLRSSEIRKISLECVATIGSVSNADHKNIQIGKAGRARWLGRRPSVRGVAMNPVDHPHGGGEGKTSGGRHPVTPWGQPTKGYKTRSNKRTDKFIIQKRKRRG